MIHFFLIVQPFCSRRRPGWREVTPEDDGDKPLDPPRAPAHSVAAATAARRPSHRV